MLQTARHALNATQHLSEGQSVDLGDGWRLMNMKPEDGGSWEIVHADD